MSTSTESPAAADAEQIVEATNVAAVQVLGNREMLEYVAAFMTGTPYLLIAFKKRLQAERRRLSRPDATMDESLLTPSMWYNPDTLRNAITHENWTLWKFAVLEQDRRVVRALGDISSTSIEHGDNIRVLSFVVQHLAPTNFLDWVYTRFASKSRQRISYAALNAVAITGKLNILQWAHAHGYVFPAITIENAAAGGHLAVVQLLHEHAPNIGTTRALAVAVKFGHIDIVRYLHEASPNCLNAAKGNALLWEHFDALKHLHTHCSKGCSAVAVTAQPQHATVDQRIACIEFALAHSFRGFDCCAVVSADFEVVRTLHERGAEGCCATTDSLRVGSVWSSDVAQHLGQARAVVQFDMTEADATARTAQPQTGQLVLAWLLYKQERKSKQKLLYVFDEALVKQAYPLER